MLAVLFGTFAAAWAVFAVVVSPAIERIETLNRRIPDKQAELYQLGAGSSQYIELRDSLAEMHAKIDSQPTHFKLLPFLESLVEQCGLSEKVASMNKRVAQIEDSYDETVVEIKLEQLSLRQLVDLITKAESSDAVATTKSLYIIKSPKNTNLLDSTIEIHSARLNPTHTPGT